MDRSNVPHRHINRDGDSYTHSHEHQAPHCQGDCDHHQATAPLRRHERTAAMVR
ncbi:MAG: hypothetical protein U5Q44_05130 [Dehalococcoidia bacterium]|nr:hypothetical protein [Dehalococcoidia bacterium]